MNDTDITIVGNVVDTPRRNRLSNGSVTNFRMASTARRFDPEAKDFVDSSTFWIDVACWGELGGNVSRSVSKGDPVIVRGFISTDSWETEAGRRSASKVRAVAVGLNLARGHADFHKQARTVPAAGAPAAEEALEAPPDAGEESFDDLSDRSTDYVEASAALYPTTADDLVAERAPEPTLT
ncbi:single-stranded DNA-binding protein [Modestobacter lapidis]|nr:single-stranded DNA-binding protein [Modestobacter lapidis]